MKNPFKTWWHNRKRRLSSRQLTTELTKLAVVFETLNKFRGAGMLYVDFKNATVTIDQYLAMQFIYDDTDWNRFLSQITLWARHTYAVNEYQKLFNKVRADAESKAYKANPSMTEEERRAVRMRAAASLDEQTAKQQVHAVPDLQFVVLGADNGKPIIVAKMVGEEFVTKSVAE